MTPPIDLHCSNAREYKSDRKATKDVHQLNMPGLEPPMGLHPCGSGLIVAGHTDVDDIDVRLRSLAFYVARHWRMNEPVCPVVPPIYRPISAIRSTSYLKIG